MAEPNTNESNVGSDSDQDFDPSAEMLVNDFDDEHTLDEEEALADDELTNKDEIEELNKEKDIPIEELLRMYGYNKPTTSDNKQDSSNILELSDSSNSNSLTSQPQSSASNNNNLNQSQLSLSDSSDDDSDEDFSVNEDEWRRTIQVGSDFQAVIPEGLKHYDQSYVDYDDIFLWKPSPTLSAQNIDEYLLEYAKSSLAADEDSLGEFVLPSGAHIKDDEQALFTLFQFKYDIKKSLHVHDSGEEPKAPLSEPMTPWTEEECRAFESGLRSLGKDFFQIKHQRIPTRSVGEVISFYYLWKKTERHDIFANKFRMEKKKYSLHPGTTDYMDRFLDEQENVSLNMQTSFTSMNITPNVQQINSQQNNSTSSNHHNTMNMNQQQSSSTSNRQSLNSAQTSSSSSSSRSHMTDTSYQHVHNNTSMSLSSGHHGRTIQVSNEPQTILINDFVSNNDDKPIVVCTGGSSNNRTNYYGHAGGSVSEISPNTTTIVVGKNPVVIDGAWVASSTSSSSTSSSSSAVAPSVSIYKLPHPSTFNR